MRIVRSNDELEEFASPGENAFVPTMGALHEGHLSLIRRAAELARPVVVSIFVNPTQFGPNEDFEHYPRRLEADVEAARAAGAEIIFAPQVETMYPLGTVPSVPRLPDVATKPGLEDAHRPGHFAGVCQVVARLFDLVRPRCAVFGEKDYQQLLVILALTAGLADRWPNLQIIGSPTVREHDGLAMSSRNAYLSRDQRERSLGLYRALHRAAVSTDPASAESAMLETLRRHELEVDYAVVRDATTLLPVRKLTSSCRALIAARVDAVRLIDNLALPIQKE